jgi:hypothetical protein
MPENLSKEAVVGMRTTAIGPPEYLTTIEVAETLRTPVETVRYWRHIGKGPKSFKIGRRVLYAADDVAAFIAEARSVVS